MPERSIRPLWKSLRKTPCHSERGAGPAFLSQCTQPCPSLLLALAFALNAQAPAPVAVYNEPLSLVGDYKEDFKRPRLPIAENGPRLLVESAGEPARSLSTGETQWLEAGKEWKIILPRQDKPMRFLMIRFKDADAGAKP